MIPLDEMYREVILDHYKAPRGKKPLSNASVSADGHNPSCGDDIRLEIEMDNGILKDIHVDCKGCAISVASGSMLAEAVKGKSFDEVQAMAERIRKMIKGDTEETEDDLGDLGALKGVRQFPVRIKCALLAWVTLIEGLNKYANGHTTGKVIMNGESDHQGQR